VSDVSDVNSTSSTGSTGSTEISTTVVFAVVFPIAAVLLMIGVCVVAMQDRKIRIFTEQYLKIKGKEPEE